MFSQACVKNSVWQTPPPPARHPREVLTDIPQADTPPWADIPGHTHPGHTPLGDDHCSERYASYRNAFLFLDSFIIVVYKIFF